MTVGIYSITDKTTGECLYVGQSKNIEDRWKQHKGKLKSGTHLKMFSSWFSKIEMDLDRVEFTILEECDDNDETKNRLEIKWFRELSPRFYGSVPSDKSTWGHSDETKKKISKSLMGNTRNSKLPKIYILKCNQCGKIFYREKFERMFCSYSCINKGRKRPSRFDVEDLKQLYHVEGKTLNQIAEIYESSESAVWAKFVEYGITRRKPSHRIDTPVKEDIHYPDKCPLCEVPFTSKRGVYKHIKACEARDTCTECWRKSMHGNRVRCRLHLRNYEKTE